MENSAKPLGEFERVPATDLGEWPAPVLWALDKLVRKANADGLATDPTELTAALLMDAYQAELVACRLGRILGRYRTLSISVREPEITQGE